MFPIPGTPPVTTVTRSDETPLTLRLNQRLTAEVLQIATDHVVLGVDGVPVVARLSASEQAGALADRRTAQFVVRGFTDQTPVLQLVDHAATGPPPAAAAQPDLLPGLLKQAGLPGDAATLNLARALLDHGLPVTPALLAELGEALGQLSEWTPADAQRAASLKAAGLPVTPGSLSLLASAPSQLGEPLARLQAQLQSLQIDKLPPPLAALVNAGLEVLNKLQVDWSAGPDKIAEQLRALVEILGQSLERQLTQASPAPSADGLLTLARLRAELAQISAGQSQLEAAVKGLDQFLDAARLAQFRNVLPHPTPGEGHWFRLDVPAGVPGDPAAHLRVAYRPGQDGDVIDATHTRLVLQLDLEDGHALEIDLSVADRQIGAWITATDEALRAGAETELAGLAAGLGQLGYHLKSAHCRVGQPIASPPGSASAGTPRASLRHVNVEA